MADESPGKKTVKFEKSTGGGDDDKDYGSATVDSPKESIQLAKIEEAKKTLFGSDSSFEEEGDDALPNNLMQVASGQGFDDDDYTDEDVEEDGKKLSSESLHSDANDAEEYPDFPEEEKPTRRKKITFDIGGDDSMLDVKSKASSSAPARRKSYFTSYNFEGADVHDMLVELYDLQPDSAGNLRWQETARWIKYEEDAEGLDRHWGKPHVAFLSFHALIQIRKCLTKGLLLLDADGNNFDDLCNMIAAAMKAEYDMDETRTAAILATLNRQHQHVHEHSTGILGRGMTHFHLPTLDRFVPRGSSHANLAKSGDEARSVTAPHLAENGMSGVAGVDNNRLTVDHAQMGRSVSQVSAHNTSRSMAFLKRRDSMPPRNDSSHSKRGSSRLLSVLGTGHRSPSTTGMDDHDQSELLKRVPENSETAQVFVGVLPELKKVRFAMVRLKSPSYIPELLEAPIPMRFIFVILGPELPDVDYHELGRSIATLMSNPEFHTAAYHADGRLGLVKAVDAFLDGSIVIPPGEIDNKRLFTVDDIKKALRKRAHKTFKKTMDKIQEDDEDKLISKDEKDKQPGGRHPSVSGASTTSTTTSTVTRTGRIFGGAIQDIRNRLPYYWSDFTDALNVQCISTVIFMFFAAFAPAITFGGLMGDYTDGTMGMMETLVAQCLGGIVWGLFAAQPLMIMSPTGPVLIFEASLYKFCKKLGLNFLKIRVWSGLWIFAICVIVVACEGVYLVSYVTQFTEDIFSLLISIIFIAESVKFLSKNFQHHPLMNLTDYHDRWNHCLDFGNHIQPKQDGITSAGAHDPIVTTLNDHNATMQSIFSTGFQFHQGVEYEMKPDHDFHCPELAVTLKSMWNHQSNNESSLIPVIHDCCAQENQPDTGLLTAILLITTFVLAVILKKLKTSQFLGKGLRRALSDFGVLIAIGIVTMLDYLVFHKPYMERLSMAATLEFTNAAKRGFGIFIPFSLPADQWWGYLFAAVPAFLVFILLFVETEITGLLLAKKERGLRKGTGFHWDLLLVGLMSFVCSIFGLPWMCAAAVQSLAHANSLAVMGRHAPGETPRVDHVIEQRVTTIGVSILIGACTFAGSFLKYLPLAVLFGVFLYLGVMNLVGVQMLQRIILFFLPSKHFPSVPYCQEVSFWRMHMYTLIQILGLVVIYLIKHFKDSALAFPFILMIITVFRVFVMPKLFSEKELEALDGHDTEYNADEDMYEGAPIPV